MRIIFLFASIIIGFILNAQHVYNINGIVLEKDSTTVIPFAYIINLKNGNGAVSNYDGRFMI